MPPAAAASAAEGEIITSSSVSTTTTATVLKPLAVTVERPPTVRSVRPVVNLRAVRSGSALLLLTFGPDPQTDTGVPRRLHLPRDGRRRRLRLLAHPLRALRARLQPLPHHHAQHGPRQGH